MASMSYCAIENCTTDLATVVDKLENIDSLGDLSPYERAAVTEFKEHATRALELIAQLE